MSWFDRVAWLIGVLVILAIAVVVLLWRVGRILNRTDGEGPND